jgi:SAM-dependent methyltransferase
MFSESEAYKRFMGRWSGDLAPAFVKFSALQNGDRVLDVGSGTGSLSLAVLRQSARNRVTGIDFSPAYVDYARADLASERASFEQGDAQALRFPDASFDATLSLLVINFIPDSDKALREMIRVTRPGGVVAAAVWDYGEGMEMLRVFWDEALALDPASASRDERNMPLCRRGELGDFWKKHGLREVRETPLVIPMEFSSFDEFWHPFLEKQGPAGAYVASLNDEQRKQLEQRLRKRLLGPTGGGAIKLSARAWAVRGVVPER